MPGPKQMPKPEPESTPPPQEEMFKQLTQVPASAVLTDQAALNLIERWAKKYAASAGMVPKTFQNNEANCAIAINIALRLNMDPLMVMQSGYPVYGQWGWLAVFYIASINTSDKFVPGSLAYVTGGEGMKSWCKCTAISRLTGKTVEGSPVSLEMAHAEGWSTKPGSKWKTMPDHMLRYRAAAFFGREYCSEKTLGMKMVDELHDIIDVDKDGNVVPTGVAGAKELLAS